MAWGHDDLGFRCGDLVGFDFADFETTFVVFAHCEGSATATTTEVIRAVGCHFHHVCCCGIDHETDFIEKPPFRTKLHGSWMVTTLLFSVLSSFILPLRIYSPMSSTTVRVSKSYCVFEIIGAFPAHGSRTVATFTEYEALAVQAVNLVVKIPGDLSRLFIITVEIPVICHVVVFRREGPLFSRGVEYFLPWQRWKAGKFRFPGIQRCKKRSCRADPERYRLFVFQFVLEFFFHPLDRVNKLFRGNTHVVSWYLLLHRQLLGGF